MPEVVTRLSESARLRRASGDWLKGKPKGAMEKLTMSSTSIVGCSCWFSWRLDEKDKKSDDELERRSRRREERDVDKLSRLFIFLGVIEYEKSPIRKGRPASPGTWMLYNEYRLWIVPALPGFGWQLMQAQVKTLSRALLADSNLPILEHPPDIRGFVALQAFYALKYKHAWI